MTRPVLIINVDDLGMCHGANTAFVDLARRGRVDSGSVMVPCPWFLEMAELGRTDPFLKLGVHLTLTSEKQFYRWRPLTDPGAGSGLVDHTGLFWRTVPEVRERADPAAVQKELTAQIETFLGAGLKPTHLDAHMGCALVPEFGDITLGLAKRYGIPALFPRTIESYDPRHNLGTLDPGFYPPRTAALEAAGKRPVDLVLETVWRDDEPAEVRTRALFGRIGPGVTFMALHANAPGEIEVIEPKSAQIRIDEYHALRDGAWIDALAVDRRTLDQIA